MRRAIIFSVVFHVCLLAFLMIRSKYFPEEKKSETPLALDKPALLPTRLLSEKDFRRIVETSATERKMNATPQDTARYLGEHTQRVDHETRASGFGSNNGKKTEHVKPKKRDDAALGDLSSIWKIPIEGEVKESHEKPTPLRKGTLDSLDPDVSVGSDTLLNTDEYIYAGFFNRVKQEVAPRWEPVIQRFLKSTLTLGDGQFSTRYAFFVNAQGDLQDTQLLESSGSKSLDDIAVRALREVGRFPNPPQSLKSANGLYRVELGFVVEYSKKNSRPSTFPILVFRAIEGDRPHCQPSCAGLGWAREVAETSFLVFHRGRCDVDRAFSGDGVVVGKR
ncbi:MAG: TonB family protein [Bdellovibrionota bacterium]